MRKWVATVLNVIVPGSGLILLRRAGLGVVLAAVFGLCVQVALWGRWIVPAVVPGWLTASAGAGAGMAWLIAQGALIAQLRLAFRPGAERELVHVCQLIEQAAARGAYQDAEELLHIALALNDEDARVNRLWAEVMTALGRFHHARRAWTRVAQVSTDAADRRQAAEALAALESPR